MTDKVRVAITQGDINGIGYELIFKAFEEPEILELCTPIVYGSPRAATYHRNYLELPASFTIIQKAEDAHPDKLNMLAAFDEELKINIGEPTIDSARAALVALNRCIDDYPSDNYDVMVSMPTNAKNMHEVDSSFTIETAYIKKKTEKIELKVEEDIQNIYLCDYNRISLVSESQSFEDTVKDITTENIIEKAKAFHLSLRRDFRIFNPRIAVLALNRTLGKEEEEIIKPAIEVLFKQGIQCFGPYETETFFTENMSEHFDGILAMYYDQVVPQQIANSSKFVCVTLGLPFVHCQGLDSKKSDVKELIYAASDIFTNRLSFDEARENPLPKLFHEHREGEERRPPKLAKLDFLDNEKEQ